MLKEMAQLDPLDFKRLMTRLQYNLEIFMAVFWDRRTQFVVHRKLLLH
jgi:hypothetical protein